MPKTLAEKLISMHAGRDVKSGELTVVKVDFAYVQDWTGPLTVDKIAELGGALVKDPSRAAIFIDHASPSSFKEVSTGHIKLRDFAKRSGCMLFDVGEGVSHLVLAEKVTSPGMLMVGADSHTCQGGALGAFCTGMGSTDVAVAMSTGETWMLCPEAIKVDITGQLGHGVYPKDVILHLIGMLGADGATYNSLEFVGDTVERMDIPSRTTISSMAVECGAKCGLFESDTHTLDWLKQNHREGDYREITHEVGAKYVRVVEIDAGSLEPMVSFPHTVDNTRPIAHPDCKDVSVQQAYLGSTTNGFFEDFEAAARILKGRHVASGTRLVVTPGTKTVYKKMLHTGLMDVFLDAGGVINSPGCGACPGSHTGILGDGERCIASINRNFKGRMGNPNSFVFLGSPALVAASAVEGKLADPRKYL
jgi:3-isopropylmalate/(R)-2-methylmalate dehydratase large subunit